MGKWRNPATCDVANLILGALLFISPWVFHFSPGAESWNAWAGGGVIVLLSIAALSAFAEWEEWINLIVGLWILLPVAAGPACRPGSVSVRAHADRSGSGGIAGAGLSPGWRCASRTVVAGIP